jgi:hypothetical protein
MRLKLRRGKPPHPKRFDLNAVPLKLKALLAVRGRFELTVPSPFNLEGTPVGSGIFAVYAVRGKLLGVMKLRGDVGAPRAFDLEGAGAEVMVFDLEGAGAEVWSYDLEGA